MSPQGDVPQTLPKVVLPRSRVQSEDEEIQMECLSQTKLAKSNVALPKTLRLRSWVKSSDEESRIESSNSKTLAVESEPIRGRPEASVWDNLLKSIRDRESLKMQFENNERLIGEETRKFFDEITPSTPSVFLCWGQPEGCRIIQVPVADDSTWTFQELHDAWYAARGEWRRWLPIFGVVSVEQVQIQFSGIFRSKKHKWADSLKNKYEDEPRSSSRVFSTYVGIYNHTPPKENKHSLEKELMEHISQMELKVSNLEHAQDHDMRRSVGEFDEYYEDELCPICRDADMDYDPPYGCPMESGYYEECGVGECKSCDETHRDRIFDKLANARRKSAITLCFRDPSLNVAPHVAFSNGWRLPGVLHVVTQLDLLEQLKYGHQACRMSNIAVPGLVIHEDWLDWRDSALIPLMVFFPLAIVVGSRFLFGDWQTGLTAGGCFAAFLTIPVLWVSHAVRR